MVGTMVRNKIVVILEDILIRLVSKDIPYKREDIMIMHINKNKAKKG